MKQKTFFILCASLLLLSFLTLNSADAASLQTRYQATGVAGDLAPPNYGLRLDGFFDGNGNHEVTFAYDNVFFDVFTDGTARLYGTVSVAEYDNSGGPGIYSSVWNMNVYFNSTTGPNGAYDYYIINPSAATELQLQSDPSNDFAQFVSYPKVISSQNVYFQVGAGANEKNSNFGASGWVNYEHTTPGGTYGSTSTHVVSSDFLMDLTVVPEPVSSLLFLIGAAMFGYRRFRTMKQTA